MSRRRPRPGWRPPAFDPSAFLRALFPLQPDPFESPSAEPGDAAIVTVQLRLRALGLFEGEADGRPSDALRASVARFQRIAGLRTSGDAHDPATRLELRDAVRGAKEAGRQPARGAAWPR